MRDSGFWVARSNWDQSPWVACAGTLGLVIAVLPWHLADGSPRWSTGLSLIAQVLLAIVLALLNWLAGGSWIVALVRLAGEIQYPAEPADKQSNSHEQPSSVD